MQTISRAGVLIEPIRVRVPNQKHPKTPDGALAKGAPGITLTLFPMKLHDLGPAIPLLIALGFQGWVTYRVWRTRVFERPQKLNQAKLIWLLPVLGAIMVFSVLHQEERAERDGPQLRL